jgi:hypothetical protein
MELDDRLSLPPWQLLCMVWMDGTSGVYSNPEPSIRSYFELHHLLIMIFD